jgi:hypothetical protein
MKAIGQRQWVIPGGHVPGTSTGAEPEFTSFDQVCILNSGDKEAEIEITIYHTDREPVGPYPLTIGARRVRHTRINDLINPLAVPLDTDYAVVIESNVPIVVLFSRQDTRQTANAIAFTLAFPAERT